jgi:hypothetical protein
METVIYVVKATGAIAMRVETRDRGEHAGDILPVKMLCRYPAGIAE